MTDTNTADLTALAAQIVMAHVSNNATQAAALPGLIASVHGALSALGQPVAEPEPETVELTPAQIRKSVTPDHIVSFIDGKPYKTLKRHLTGQGITPEEYRRKYGLSSDYPMTAANYAAYRSEMAKSIGLGTTDHQRVSGRKLAVVR
jgi:predicted transcriptional regulator